MSWAEFVLRSIGFREQREFEMMMTREVSYELYKNGFVFAKGKPVKKDKFWPIGKKKKRVSKVSDAARQKFMKAFEAYKKKVDGNNS